MAACTTSSATTTSSSKRPAHVDVRVPHAIPERASRGNLRVRIEHGHTYDAFYVASPRVYEMLGMAATPFLHLYPDIYRLWSATARARVRAGRMISGTPDEYASAEQEAAAMIANRGFDVVVFGHTHRAGTRRAPPRRHVPQLRELAARHHVRADRRRLGLAPRVARVRTGPDLGPDRPPHRSPNGIRTRAATLRGWCPRPLDDGAK